MKNDENILALIKLSNFNDYNNFIQRCYANNIGFRVDKVKYTGIVNELYLFLYNNNIIYSSCYIGYYYIHFCFDTNRNHDLFLEFIDKGKNYCFNLGGQDYTNLQQCFKIIRSYNV